jgi:hypothetical protein
LKLSEEGPAITSQLDLHLDAQVRLACSFTCEQFCAHAEPRKTVRENHRSNLANLMARFCFQFLNPKNPNPKKKGLGIFFFCFGQALQNLFEIHIQILYLVHVFVCFEQLKNLLKFYKTLLNSMYNKNDLKSYGCVN